jgi:tetratricopeptide (TPR) repeat protein
MSFEDEHVDSILRASYDLAGAGRDEDNLRLLHDALERFPIDPELCLWAAACLSAAGDEDEAMRLVGRAADAWPDDPSVLTRAAAIAHGLDQVDELRDYLERANRAAPDDFERTVDLVYLEGCLAFHDERLEAAERLLRAAFETEPGTLGHGGALGRLYLRQDRVDEALAIVADALHRLPGDVGLLGVRMDAYVRIVGGGKEEDAARDSDPDYPYDELVATIDRAQTLYEEGLIDEYLRFVVAATDRFPLDVNLATRLTGALIETGEPELAKEPLLRTLELGPDDPWNLLNCAGLAHSIGDLELAEQLLRRAARLVPDGWERATEVVALAGDLAARRGDDESAERYHRSAFDVLPEEAPYGRDLADFLLNRGRPSEALEVVAKALRLSPDDPELRSLKGRILAAFQAGAT